MGLFDSKKTETSKSSQSGKSWSDLSDDATNYWQNIQGRFSDPWTPVGLDPAQTAATQAQAGYASGLNPAFNTATSIGQSGITTADIQRFQNPYEDQVVRNTLDDMRYADSQALAQSNAAAAKAGALGGTAFGVRRNDLEDKFKEARDKTITGIRQQGFNTAADLAGRSAQTQVAGVGAASGVAGQMGNLTNQYYGMGAQNTAQRMQDAQMPYQIAQWGASTLGNLAGAGTQYQEGTNNTQTQTKAQPGIGNTIMNAAGMALKAYMASDERVKEDIIPIGESFDGQPIYEFNYKGDPRRTIGLLAQDVEERAPEAVTEVDGVKMVDYDRALKDSKPGRSMSGGGAVGGDSQGEKDPHSKFRSAFEAITGMLSKARGGAVSGLTPPGRAAGGPAMGVWDTTVTPAAAPASGNPAMSGLADDMMKFGKEDGQQKGGGSSHHQTSAALAQMLSGMRRPGRPFGGAVWGETGPEFEDNRPSGLEPPAYTSATPDPVARRELPPARAGSPFPSDEGALLTAIKGFEGYNPRAYGDYKQHSVGYGTRARHPGEVIDKGEAERRLADEVARARGIVDKFAPNIDPGTRAALTSLTYNAGDGWTRAGLGEAIRTGNMDEARRRFVQYNKAGGEELPGLVARRRAEAAWMGGLPPASGGASIPTSGRGEVVASGDATGSDDPKAFLDRLYPKSRMSAGLNSLADSMLAWKDPLFGSRTEGMAQHFAKKTADEASARMDALRADRQASQFAQRLARERDTALGVLDGQKTVDARRTEAAIANDAATQARQAAEAATKQEAVFLDRAGAVAQAIANDVDPTAAQAKWDALIRADPRYAELLKKGGIDPADHKAGAAYIQSIARGFKEQPKLGVTDLKQGEVKIFYDPKTGKEVGRLEGPGGVLKYEDKIKAEEGLRKEVNTYAKDYTTIRDATSTLERVAKAGTAFSDMATIFQYMKILDPGSVVREGEFANAQNAAGVPDQVVNMYNKALAGNFLNQKQREDIVARARDVATTKRTYYDGRLRQYSDLAKRSGLDPNNVILIEPKTEAEATSGAPAPGGAPVVPNPAQGLSDDEIKKRLGIP